MKKVIGGLTFFGGGDQIVRIDLRKTIKRRVIRRHERYGRGGRGSGRAFARGRTDPCNGRRRLGVPAPIVADFIGRRRRHYEYDYHSKTMWLHRRTGYYNIIL